MPSWNDAIAICMLEVFYLFISFPVSLTQSLTSSQQLLVRKLTSFQILHKTSLFISVSLCVVDFISLRKGDVLSYTPMSLWLQSLLHRYCILLQASRHTSQWGSHTDKRSQKQTKKTKKHCIPRRFRFIHADKHLYQQWEREWHLYKYCSSTRNKTLLLE